MDPLVEHIVKIETLRWRVRDSCTLRSHLIHFLCHTLFFFFFVFQTPAKQPGPIDYSIKYPENSFIGPLLTAFLLDCLEGGASAKVVEFEGVL